MQKYLFGLAMILMVFSVSIFPQEKKYYAGLNVFALSSFIEVDGAGMIGSMISNSEYGISLNGGYLPTKNSLLEGRISIGKPNKIYWAPQLHFGYNFFALKHFGISEMNLYTGGFLKFYDLYNTQTSIHYFNVIPYVTIGYLWNSSDFVFDLRLNQTLYAVTWSTQKHTKAGSGFFFSPFKSWVPVLPNLSFNVAYWF